DRLDEARLAAAALAHDADDFPGRHLERDVPQRMEHALVGAVGEVEMLDGKGRRRHQRLPARLGSKVSRSASPRKVKPGVGMMMGSPPAITGQGDSRMEEEPSLTVLPQEGVGGRTPRPRKLIPASIATTTGISMEATIRIGPMILGRMWVAMIRPEPAPSERSASTNSAWRTERVWVRAIRA